MVNQRPEGNSSTGWQQGHNAQGRGNRPMGPWFCYNPWASQGGAPSGGGWQQGPSPGGWQQGAQGGRNQGLLGAHPQANFAAPPPLSPMWEQAGLIAALNQMALQNSGWVMDSGVTSHMHNTDGILLSRQPSYNPSITVGNGHHLPVSCSGKLHITWQHFLLFTSQCSRCPLSSAQLTFSSPIYS